MARLAEVRIPNFWRLAAISLAVALVVLTWLGTMQGFHGDEWDYIQDAPRIDVGALFVPRNGHWSTIPILIYNILFRTVGLRSYVPYLFAAQAMHLACVLLMVIFIRRRAGDLPAAAAGVVLLFFGNGVDNILWAFQVGFLGSILFGLVAWLLLDQRQLAAWQLGAASLALLLSLMSSGVGVTFCMAIGLDLLLDRTRRRRLAVMLIPGVAFIVWFFVAGPGLGIASGQAVQATVSIGRVSLPIKLTLLGVGSTILSVFGIYRGAGASAIGVGVTVVASGVAVVIWRRVGRPDSRIVGAMMGLFGQFILTSAVRADLGIKNTISSRYVYISAVFALIVVADLLRHLPWRGWSRRFFVGGVAFATLANALVLGSIGVVRAGDIPYNTAELQALTFLRDAPGMRRDVQADPRALDNVRPGYYYVAIDQFQSPVPAVDRAGFEALPPDALNAVMANVFGPNLLVDTAPTLVLSPPCRPLSQEPAGIGELVAPAGSKVLVSAPEGTRVHLYLWYAPGGRHLEVAGVTSAGLMSIALPDTGHGLSWHLGLATEDHAALSVCG